MGVVRLLSRDICRGLHIQENERTHEAIVHRSSRGDRRIVISHNSRCGDRGAFLDVVERCDASLFEITMEWRSGSNSSACMSASTASSYRRAHSNNDVRHRWRSDQHRPSRVLQTIHAKSAVQASVASPTLS